MSWCKNVLFLMLLFVSACGFQPMYGAADPAGPALVVPYKDIEIANIPDRDGQYLRNQLIDRLYTEGTPTAYKYLLKIDPLKKTVSDIGVRKDATYTRGEIKFNARLTLIEKQTGKILLERDLRSLGGFNLLDNQIATIVSQQTLAEHLLEEMSDNIVNELNLYFKR